VRVGVRDASGDRVFGGTMSLGEHKRLRVVPPVTVHADDGGAVEVRVAGQDKGTLGEPGLPARRTFTVHAGR
jgi:hypothetical protein